VRVRVFVRVCKCVRASAVPALSCEPHPQGPPRGASASVALFACVVAPSSPPLLG
jgi:hypothetical protein